MVGIPGKGSLLVASPTLADPNFSRSVIFLLAHDDDDGTLGVVLNRPSPIPVRRDRPRVGRSRGRAFGAFHRGPCSAERGDLHRAYRAPRRCGGGRFAPLFGSLGTVDLHEDPADVPVRLAEIRVFTGYAGWGPGQLANEIGTGILACARGLRPGRSLRRPRRALVPGPPSSGRMARGARALPG